MSFLLLQQCWKDSVDYIQNVVLHEKNVNITINDCSQILLTYEYMDDELWLHLSSLNDKSTIEKLIKTVNTQKNIWFNIYAQNQSTTLNRQLQYQQQQQVYDRNCSFQSYQSFNVRFGELNQSQSFFHYDQFSYNNQFSYVSYRNQFSNNFEQINNRSQKQQNCGNTA